MNKFNFIFIFLTFVFLSNTCQTINKAPEQKRIVTISVDTEENSQVIPNVDEGSSYTEYGPGQINQDNVVKEEQSIQTAGIIIGANSNFDTEVMDYILCLNKNDIRINFVSGIGASSVIAALYAQTRKPELVKWKIFRLKEKNNVDEILEELALSVRSIKRSSIALYLAREKKRTIYFDTKGSIKNSIKDNMKKHQSFLNEKHFIENDHGSTLIANRIFVFSYDKNLAVSKNYINGKIIQINMPKQNYSLMKKCEIIKENL